MNTIKIAIKQTLVFLMAMLSIVAYTASVALCFFPEWFDIVLVVPLACILCFSQWYLIFGWKS